MAIARLDVEEDKRPVMHHIPATRNTASAAPGPASRGNQDGLRAQRQDNGRRTFTSCRKVGRCQTAGDFRAAGACMSLVYQPEAMRFRRRAGVDQHDSGRARQRGPGENQFVSVIEPMIDKAGASAEHGPFRHPHPQRAGFEQQIRPGPRPGDQRLPEGALAKLRTLANWTSSRRSPARRTAPK